MVAKVEFCKDADTNVIEKLVKANISFWLIRLIELIMFEGRESKS